MPSNSWRKPATAATEVKMQQLKMRLRVICNAILDQSIHTANMSEQEALDLMMKEGFQQEGEAVAKWKRARLSSTQLSTYFVGATEHLELRERAKKKRRREVRSEEVQRQRALLRKPAREIRPRAPGVVTGGTRGRVLQTGRDSAVRFGASVGGYLQR